MNILEDKQYKLTLKIKSLEQQLLLMRGALAEVDTQINSAVECCGKKIPAAY